MSVIKNKYSYNYYIGYTDDVDYIYDELLDVKIDNINLFIDYKVYLLKKVPTTTMYNYIDSNDEIQRVTKFKTITKLLLNYLDNIAENDTDSGNDYEAIESLMDNCVIIRENVKNGECKIVDESSVYTSFNKILYKFYYNSDSITPKNEETEVVIIDIESFYNTIKNCMSIFNTAILNTANGEVFKVKFKNGELFFGDKKTSDKSFRINLPQNIYYGYGCILRVETTSKIDGNMVYEIYGIFSNSEFTKVFDAQTVMEMTYKNISPDDDINKYDIYCDLEGNRIGKLIS